ncbi:MAG: glutathione S-transferase N-terminal domain-containing protein [Pseudomonadota bacterium]|nr:glutathione S-transferase N-terminal domain-containing protein [Pseudomonadota bacterium]
MTIQNTAIRKSAMTLFSGPNCIYSHCCRFVLQEKGVEYELAYISKDSDPAELGELNPYGETPTLLDRDLVLYEVPTIIEYLDERFPHPPLMPVDPISRAKTRLMIARLKRDWMQPISEAEQAAGKAADKVLAKSMHDGLLALSPLFAEQPFLLGDDFTLVDGFMAPLLWRLPALDVKLPKQAKPLLDYAERLFARQSFQESLSPREQDIR